MNKAFVFGTIGITCLLSAHQSTAEDKEKVSIRPCVTLTGHDSRVSKQAFHRIRSLDDWAKIWAQHTGQTKVPYKNWDNQYDQFYNPLNLPLVDFDNHMVVAIFQGTGWNNAGLSAVSISENENGITFRFEDKPYSTEGPDGGGKKVNVYGFFVIPRSNKQVILEEKTLRMKQEKLVEDPNLERPFDKSKSYTEDWVERVKFEKVK